MCPIQLHFLLRICVAIIVIIVTLFYVENVGSGFPKSSKPEARVRKKIKIKIGRSVPGLLFSTDWTEQASSIKFLL